MRLLGGREHSRAELERKLAAHEQEAGQLRRVLDDLQAKGFIREERVVESVLHRRGPKLGAGRIRQELQAKGLAPELVAQAMQQLRSTEVDRARAIWARRFGAPPQDAAERAKQSRFLAARGFSGEVIGKVLGARSDADA